MSSSVTYAVANDDDDELLTFAARGDSVAVDTSAGVSMGEDNLEDLDALTAASYAGKTKTHRRCLWLIIPVLLFAAVGAIVGIVLETHHKKVAPENASLPDLAKGAAVPTFGVKVLTRSKHDQNAFTQGLEFARGYFYESAGGYGQSSLRKVNVSTGKILQKYDFNDSKLFAEGLTLHKDHHIFVLTWKSGRGFIFHQKTFELLKEWKYEGEGWGLTMDDEKDEVYMSNGTEVLRILEPENLTEKRTLRVTLKGKPVHRMNELEWICGEIWANVWLNKSIYRINPTSGHVTSIIDAKNLPPPEDVLPSQNVLNGIAYDKKTGRLWLTGKLWSHVYQVSVNDKSLDLKNCKQSAK